MSKKYKKLKIIGYTSLVAGLFTGCLLAKGIPGGIAVEVDNEPTEQVVEEDNLLSGWYQVDKERDKLTYSKVEQARQDKVREETERIVAERLAEEQRLEEERLEKERIAAENLAEEQRIAEEQRLEKERVENERLEQERIAEQKRKEEQAKQTPTPSTEVAQESKPSTTSTPSEPKQTPPPKEEVKPQPRTDGFNFKGHHFPLSTFSGTGQVPLHTPYVFQWTNRPSHYLIERISPAGNVITSVGMGDKVTINGREYTVTAIERDVQNTATASTILDKHPATITFQTCQTNRDSSGRAFLTIWYAQ